MLKFCVLIVICIILSFNFIICENYYNIPDPDCTGSFGICTQRDKDILGYKAIKKLHELIDDDQDGQVEEGETKDFMKEELQYINDFERQNKLHGSDSLITVDELWKAWKNSEVHNWTTDDVVFWLVEQVKLPQYIDNIRRNRIDGQFLPRLAVNDNNYYSVVMQIKDARHRNRIMLKATDLILFGQQTRPNSLIKDIIMITLVTASLIGCIFAFSKHRKSQEQIKQLMKEFDQIGCDERNLLQFKNDKNSKSYRKNEKDSNENEKLMDELKAAKDEAENLKKTRESTISELQRLKLAEQELETVRMALQQTEKQLALTKYQAPVQLVQLLTRTYESEKELLEFKFKLIDQEKENCLDELNKVSKRQAGIFGALKIAHSSALEEINSKLELLKCQIQRCKIEKQEWTKRWTSIDEIISRISDASNSNISDSASQDFPFFSLDSGLLLPKRIWGYDSQSNLSNFTRLNTNLNQNKVHSSDDGPKSIYNLVSSTINSFGIQQTDDNLQQKLINYSSNYNNNNSSTGNQNNKLKLITSAAKMNSLQQQQQQQNIPVPPPPTPILFTISDDDNENKNHINIKNNDLNNNDNNNNLMIPNSMTDNGSDKTPTNSMHNIETDLIKNNKKLTNNNEILNINNSNNYISNNSNNNNDNSNDCDKTSNLSFRNYSIDDNIDKISKSDIDSLYIHTVDNDNHSDTNINKINIAASVSSTFSEKKRSKTLMNFRKILPFVKSSKKLKTK